MQKKRLAGESGFAFRACETFPSEFDLLYLSKSSISTLEEKNRKKRKCQNGNVKGPFFFLTQKTSKQETQLAESFLATIPVQ